MRTIGGATIIQAPAGFFVHYLRNGALDESGLPIVAFAITEMNAGEDAGSFDVKPISPLGEVDSEDNYAVRYPDGRFEVAGGRMLESIGDAEAFFRPRAA